METSNRRSEADNGGAGSAVKLKLQVEGRAQSEPGISSNFAIMSANGKL